MSNKNGIKRNKTKNNHRAPSHKVPGINHDMTGNNGKKTSCSFEISQKYPDNIAHTQKSKVKVINEGLKR